MSKEVSEKKKTNPLVYILGIPVGIFILVIAYNTWEKDSTYRACASNIYALGSRLDDRNQWIPHCLQVLGR